MTAPLADRLPRLLANVAAAALIVMLAVTVCDVLLRNLFNRPILGTTEIVQLTLVYVVFLGIPETFLRRSHVTVDVADHLFRASTIRRFDLIGEVAALVLMVVMLWTMWNNARDAYEMGDTTSDLAIPLSLFWGPMLLGGACSILALLLLTVRDLRGRPDPET